MTIYDQVMDTYDQVMTIYNISLPVMARYKICFLRLARKLLPFMTIVSLAIYFIFDVTH